MMKETNFSNHITHSRWSQSLTDLLRRQLGIIDDLVILAQAQAALISSGEAEQLLQLLARRQRLIDCFAASQSELGQLTQGLQSEMHSLKSGERQHVQSLMTQISDKLAWIMNRDEADQAMLRTNRDVVKAELSVLGAAKQARGAYGSGSRPDARFADQRG